tara:strand:- start:9670 stop:10386 length:717 start_codon:yes stop_codon:yes gene_type:complete
VKHITKYIEFNSVNESSSNDKDLLCKLIFKDLVNHLTGKPYEIKTTGVHFNIESDIEEESIENDGNFYDSDVNLEIKIGLGTEVPDNIAKLLISTGIYGDSYSEVYNMEDPKDRHMYGDLFGTWSPEFVITIMDIEIDLNYDYYNLPGTYESPPESEHTFEEGEYTLSDPFTIYIESEHYSIETSINRNDSELKDFIILFEKACMFYGEPGDVSFYLDSNSKGSDTAREKERFRRINS